VATATPENVTFTGALSLLGQPDDLDSVTVKVIVPAEPLMRPVPVNGV